MISPLHVLLAQKSPSHLLKGCVPFPVLVFAIFTSYVVTWKVCDFQMTAFCRVKLTVSLSGKAAKRLNGSDYIFFSLSV